ncbi:MAG: TrmH family RNA methyltransferase [Bacilli bacterium]
MEKIESLDNKKVKYWTKLNLKKYRDLEKKFLVEGEHLVNEALKSGLLLEVIRTEDYECFSQVENYIVSYDVLKKISNTMSPQKVMGVCKMKEIKPLDDKILILDDIQDPGNFGTIIRSCIAFNINTIVVSNNTVSEYNDKTIRASEGMIFNINIVRCDISPLIDRLKDNGYRIYGTKVDEGKLISNVPITPKFALIMGNEGAGVRKDILEKCDDYFYIKMSEKCESLNVGVATSILLYELDKRG